MKKCEAQMEEIVEDCLGKDRKKSEYILIKLNK